MGAARSDWVELQRPPSVSDAPPSDPRGTPGVHLALAISSNQNLTRLTLNILVL